MKYKSTIKHSIPITAPMIVLNISILSSMLSSPTKRLNRNGITLPPGNTYMRKPKTSMTNIDVAAWISETRETIRGSRIINIYRLNESIYIFKIQGPTAGGKVNLLVEPSRRIHLTKYIKEHKYKTIPPIVAKLRKHLRGGIIKDIHQLELDRIIIIEVVKSNEHYKLVVELIPRGILALLDEEGAILIASKYMELKDRVIQVGRKYKPPPLSANILRLSIEDFISLVNKGVDIVRGLIRYIGLPGEVAEEILHRLNINKNVKPSELPIDEYRKLFNFTKKFISEIIHLKEKPCHIIQSGTPITVLPFKPTSISKDIEVKEYNKFNEALDEYFINVLKKEIVEKELKMLEEEIKKLEKSIEKQKESLNKCIEELTNKRLTLQKIYENYNTIEKLWNNILESFRESRWNGLKKFHEVIGINKNRGIVKIKVNDIEVGFDIRRTLNENIVKVQQEVRELEKKISKIEDAIKEMKEKIRKLREEGIKAKKKAELKVRKKEWFEKYHWIITTNGFLAIGGRNAQQNESIVRKYLDENDIFIHANIHGAPAVVLKTMSREPAMKDIEDAALIAATYSRAWKEGLATIDVFWVKGSQVSKTPPSGEYLARGAFMIYGKRNYVKNVELKLTIGVKVYGEGYKIIVGPEDLVSKQATCYAVLAPNEIDPPQLARKLVNLWINKCKKEEHKLVMESIDINELIQRIPGKSKILKVECYS